MQRLGRSARRRAWCCFAVIGAGGIAGLLAVSETGEALTKEVSPAQVVASRFPSAWNDATALPAPTASAVTTVDKQQSAILFDPNPVYELASADPNSAVAPAALAYASLGTQPVDGTTDSAAEAPADSAAEATADSAPVVAEQETAAPVQAAERPSQPRAARNNHNTTTNNILFNDAQLASIKHRLRLTPDQEQYWPQVAAALRAISYRLGRQVGDKSVVGPKSRVASIDPNSSEVQRLKSAAIPLIMTMREDQKREVRALARLMGLEAVASQI